MKATLQHMFRNDPEALELIDEYMQHLNLSYEAEEINRLKSDPYALQADFEAYSERVDYNAQQIEYHTRSTIEWPVEVRSGRFRG